MSARRRTGRLLALALLAAAACDGIDNVDVDVDARARVAARTLLDDLLGVVPLEGFDEAAFERELRNQGVAEDDVDSVRLTRFALVVESPPGQSLDFLERASFFVSAEGHPEVRIAHVEAVAAGARSIELATDDVELEPYVTAPRMSVRAELEGERPESATTIRAELTFDVDITVPGCG